MRIIFEYAAFYFKIHVRQPSYVLSTLIFPSLFFLMFAHPNAKTSDHAHLLMASFCAFAVLGVAFLDFGVSIAKERTSGWSRYIRTLPVSANKVFLGRSLNAVVFSLLAAALVVLVVNLSTDANLEVPKYFSLLGVLILGLIPFALMGIAIGYLTTASSSLPVANLFYLTLSFIGGLWIPPEGLPERIQDISVYSPTRFYGEFVWAATLDGHELKEQYVWSAAIYTLMAALLAFRAYSKDKK